MYFHCRRAPPNKKLFIGQLFAMDIPSSKNCENLNVTETMEEKIESIEVNSILNLNGNLTTLPPSLPPLVPNTVVSFDLPVIDSTKKIQKVNLIDQMNELSRTSISEIKPSKKKKGKQPLTDEDLDQFTTQLILSLN